MSKRKNRIKIDHSLCDCMVRQRGPHWGLFCQPHNKYIKWLNHTELFELSKTDIPWITESRPQRLDDLPLVEYDNSPWK